jgi:hypothetical protein
VVIFPNFGIERFIFWLMRTVTIALRAIKEINEIKKYANKLTILKFPQH